LLEVFLDQHVKNFFAIDVDLNVKVRYRKIITGF